MHCILHPNKCHQHLPDVITDASLRDPGSSASPSLPVSPGALVCRSVSYPQLVRASIPLMGTTAVSWYLASQPGVTHDNQKNGLKM